MFLFFEIIKYYWFAKGRHGIHSPFVYDFVDICLRIPIPSDFSKNRNSLYRQLLSSKESILVNDQGVGSKKLKNKRKISEIFTISSSKGKYADLLYRVSNHYQPAKILELGTSLGIGTIHLKCGNLKSSIITVDACSETINLAKRNFKQFNFEINSLNQKFHDFINSLTNEKFDLIYVDGHHDGNALISYVNRLLPFTHNESIFVLDDIRWSQSMLNAWNELKDSQNFNVTIDLFRMGILTPRNQQTKEHFIVRI